MIETRQTALVEAGIDEVWAYVQDIARWASIMPGYRECEIVDENDSRWTLKVGVGGLVRTVRVNVHVDEWNGPGQVHFSYRLAGDPVQGGGTYTATPRQANQTEIALEVRVEGSGPMAPMWEAMGKPLLPTFAKAFAEQLRDEIERSGSTPPEAGIQRPRNLMSWLRALWNALLGRSRSREN